MKAYWPSTELERAVDEQRARIDKRATELVRAGWRLWDALERARIEERNRSRRFLDPRAVR